MVLRSCRLLPAGPFYFQTLSSDVIRPRWTAYDRGISRTPPTTTVSIFWSRMCRQIVVYETPSRLANSPTRKPKRRLTGTVTTLRSIVSSVSFSERGLAWRPRGRNGGLPSILP